MTDSDAGLEERARDTTPIKRSRLQSSVQFPYGDLDSAIELAAAMHNAGYRECAPDQLAAAMQKQASSGTFRLKVSAARIFGLIDTSPGRISLTDLGYRALDSIQEKKARVDAFLNVELYRRLYDDFRGKQLPPRPAALERAFENYGVSPKQTDKARQAFDRSAKQAGFFNHGNDRLVMPGGLDAPDRGVAASQEPTEPTVRAGGRGGNGGAGSGSGTGDILSRLDPLVVALLQKMPPRDKPWPLADQAKWLRALAINLSFAYDAGDAKDEIQVSLRSAPGSNDG